MLIARDTHERLFLEALDYVGLDERCTVLFLVAGERPPDAVEVAYLPPPDPDYLSYCVFRRVGEARIYEYRSQHRFAAFQDVEDGPLAGVAVELCHEAQHGVQFEQYGPQFNEINEIVRRALPNDPALYRQIPTEYDANRVAALFARDRYSGDLEAMAADHRFEQYTLHYDAERDLLEPTLEMLWQHADPNTADRDGKTLCEVVAELAEGSRQWQAARGDPWRRCVERLETQECVVIVDDGKRIR